MSAKRYANSLGFETYTSVHEIINVHYVGCRVESAPGTRGTVQVYPYDEKNPCGPSRDHKHTLLHAQEAMSSGKPVSQYRVTVPVTIYSLYTI